MTPEPLAPDERRSGKEIADPSRRVASHRDHDRILYSESFRRLGGVTQVALGTPDMVLHNRLTHSLKVEQVGLSIHSRLVGDQVQGMNEYAIAAACLAHDLGHPPFGHAGEQELNAILTCVVHRSSARPLAARTDDPCEDCWLEDGFEGNAQSFRILTALAVHKDSDAQQEPLGLDLTGATLRAVSKYPWARGDNTAKPNKWGAYDCDVDVLRRVTGGDQEPNLDAQIMDWADDISYAVHDIEDFYRTNHIPLEQYRPDEEALKKFLEYALAPNAVGPVSDEVRGALDEMLTFLPKRRFEGKTADFADLDKARGVLLTQFINGAVVVDGELTIDPIQKKVNAIVKQFIWFHVIDGPQLTNIQAGQRKVLRDIFLALKDAAMVAFKIGEEGAPTEQDLRRLPHALRRSIEVANAQSASPYTAKQKVYRGLTDYVAGLSDAEAYNQHAVLKGREPAGHL